MGQDPDLSLERPIASLNLSKEITARLAGSADPPANVGALLKLAHAGTLGDITGIGPARKRAIEQSLHRAGHPLGDRPGRRFHLPGRAS